MRPLSKFLPLVLAVAMLQGCGGGGGSTTYYDFRLVNATSSALDMVTNGNTLASNVGYGTASNSVSLASGSYRIQFEDTVTGSPITVINSTFSTGTPYMLVAYTSGPSSNQSVGIAQLTENELAPASGYGEIRIADLAADAGNLDVYITPTTTLFPALPTWNNLSGTSYYYAFNNNSYDIKVTSAGNQADVRLFITGVALSNQQILTLVLTGTSGGGLVDGMLVTQPGTIASGLNTVTPEQNTNARIRIAANANSALSSANAGGLDLLGGSTSFNTAIGFYILVPAGSTVIAESSGTCASILPSSTITTTPGEDLTLLLTATTCTVLVDDNTRPASGYAKLRLVNGINGGSPVSLTDNSVLIASYVALGLASDPNANNKQGNVITNTNNSSALDVYYSSTLTSVYSTSNARLSPQGIYSLFMLGGSGTEKGLLVPYN